MHKLLGLIESSLGFGKQLGEYTWLHASALKCSDYALKDTILHYMDVDFCVVRISKKNQSFQLSNCPLFDRQREPVILGQRSYSDSGKLIKESIVNTQNPFIFHHKHLFVAPHYSEFDIHKSRQWSILWKSTLPQCRSVSSRIGRVNGWREQLNKYALPITE